MSIFKKESTQTIKRVNSNSRNVNKVWYLHEIARLEAEKRKKAKTVRGKAKAFVKAVVKRIPKMTSSPSPRPRAPKPARILFKVDTRKNLEKIAKLASSKARPTPRLERSRSAK